MLKKLNFALIVLFLFGCQNSEQQSNSEDRSGKAGSKDATAGPIDKMFRLSEELAFRNPDSARLILREAGTLIQANDLGRKAEYLTVEAVIYWYRAEYDSAILTYQKVMILQDREEIMPFKSRSANNIGALYGMYSEYDSSRQYLEISLSIDQQLGNMRGITKNYYDLGVLYKRLDMYEVSLGYYLKALDYQEKDKDTFRLVHSLNAIGNLYTLMNRYDKALVVYRRALELDLASEKVDVLAQTYNNISVVYLDGFENPDSTIYYCERGLEHLSERGIDNFITLHNNMGEAYLQLNMPKLAYKYHRKSFERFSENKKPLIHSRQFFSLANYFFVTGNMDSARYYTGKSMEKAIEVQSLKMKDLNLKMLSKIDSAQGNYYLALKHFQEASQINDSILSSENLKRLAELDFIYETEKKEAENLYLREQNELNKQIIRNQKKLHWIGVAAFVFFALFVFTQYNSNRKLLKKNREVMNHQLEIEAKNSQLTELNQTKDKFFSIISHDLRGPFSSLLPLLNAIIDDYHLITEGEKLGMLKAIRKSSENTYNLLVNLLDWSRSQQGRIGVSKTICRLSEVVEEVFEVVQARANSKNHTLLQGITDECSFHTDRQLLANILINLVNNSIKFTPPGGKIEVTCQIEEQKALLFVRDNGIGIPSGQIPKLFRLDSDMNRIGTDQELGTGLGLILVKEYVDLLGGEILVESNDDPSSSERGSTFCVSLPV
jgi:signal transduction histidine kinase